MENIEVITDESNVSVCKKDITSFVEQKYIDTTTISGSENTISVIKKEYKLVGDDVYIGKTYEDAPQWIRDFINNVVDFSIGKKITDLNSVTTSLNSLIEELNIAKNTYTNSIIFSADIDERINTAITTLNSSIAQSNANIIDLISTKATPDQAIALSTDVLQTSINNGEINSLIANLQTSISNNTQSLGNNIDTVYAEMNGEFENIAGEFEGTAGAINTLEASVTSVENTLISQSNQITNLSTELTNGTNTWSSADSSLENSLRTEITDEGSRVESKFAYNSNVNINGIWKKSGFGLTTNYVSGNGTQANPYVSEFWIDASRLRFTNSNQTGQATPFLIDASGTQPKVTFNGLVTFGSGQTGTIEEAIASTIETVQVGDKNINITDNLIPTTSLVGDSNNAGYQFVGAPIKSYVAGIDSFAEAQVALSSGDEVYSMYVDELTVPYYFRFGIKGITSLDNFKVVTLDSLDTVTYGVVTVTMLDSYSVDANEWYVVDGIINPSGGSTTASGAIRLSNGTKVGEINNYVMPSGSTKLLLGWTGACTISRMKLAKITADTITTDYASKDYVSTSISESGYVRPEEVANAINTNTTTIEGSKITTGSIAADKINTTGLIAENISATEINGITINGGVINGARINGAVIKASYLDLNGELEVLTNYIISVATRNANPSLYTDAVYISADNQYRIPTMSVVSEPFKSLTPLSLNSSFYGTLRPYNSANVGHNLKATKIRPVFQNIPTQLLSLSVGLADDGYNYGAVAVQLLIDDTVIGTFRLGNHTDRSTNHDGFWGFQGNFVNYWQTIHNENHYPADISGIPVIGAIRCTPGHTEFYDYDSENGANVSSTFSLNVEIIAGSGGELPFNWTGGRISFKRINGSYGNYRNGGTARVCLNGISINNMV